MDLDLMEIANPAGSEEPLPETVFNPSAYFDRWLQDVAEARKHLSQKSSNEVSEFFFESLPGSNCEVTFEGVLHFDGHSMGNIRSPDGTLVVTKRGIVDADIEVGVALINGSVTGNITANERVYLGDDARVTGQIQTRLLSVRQGAVFEGDCLFTSPLDSSSNNECGKNEHEVQEEEEHLLVGA